jgi:hypothetical protein
LILYLYLYFTIYNIPNNYIMNMMSMSIQPKELVTTRRVVRARVYVKSIELFTKVVVGIEYCDSIGILFDGPTIVISGDDYLKWESDDSYIVNYAYQQLGIVPLPEPAPAPAPEPEPEPEPVPPSEESVQEPVPSSDASSEATPAPDASSSDAAPASSDATPAPDASSSEATPAPDASSSEASSQ